MYAETEPNTITKNDIKKYNYKEIFQLTKKNYFMTS